MIQTLEATRYLVPLREGGSLPAVVDTNDGGQFVLKFVGAGQGPKALIAELVAGEIARHLGLPVPEIALITLNPMLGRSEPDPEIQDLIKASAGLNLGLRYLPNALAYNVLAPPPVSPEFASQLVWFDAFVTNVDRTPRNVNLLVWQDAVWLIDHGAAMYFHHSWDNYLAQSQTPFAYIKDHTLLSKAAALPETDREFRARLTRPAIEGIVQAIPDTWLNGESAFATPAEHRAAYVTYLLKRLESSSIFVEEAINARARLV